MPLYLDAGEDTRPWPERIWRRLLALSNTTYDHMKVTDFLQEVARGNVPGAVPFSSYGERTAAAGETNRVIWPSGVFSVPGPSGVQISIASTSGNDTDGGTGINIVELHYLDTDLNEQYEHITLAGATPVLTTATNIRFVQCMHLLEAGSLNQADGIITASSGGTVYSQINAGDNRCPSSARMVPNGKRLFVAGAAAGSVSGTAAAGVKVRIVASQIDANQFIDPYILFPFGSIGIQDTSESFNFPVTPPFDAGTIVALTLTTDKAAIVSGSWYGWLENA